MRITILAFFIWSCQAVWVIAENCPRPPLENGFFVPHLEKYDHGVSISYGCNTGLKPALETWWGEITCRNGQWSHEPQCIDNTWCIAPHVPNAQPVHELQTYYPPSDDVSFKCDYGYEFEGGKSEAQCVNGTWRLPVCKRKPKTCDPPPRVYNGMILQPYQDVFEHGDQLEYVCAKGYNQRTSNYNTCHNGKWSSSPSCDKPLCPKPQVQNAYPAAALKNSYYNGDTVRFVCNRGYRFEGTDSAECVDETWRLPVCKDPTSCTTPHVPNARPAETLAEVYSNGRYVRFECDSGYEFERRDPYARCVDGTWRLPVCQLKCSVPHVPNARPLEGLDASYSSGRFVTFECNPGYEFAGLHYAQCVDGTWRVPVCKPRGETVCTAPHVPNAKPANELASFYATGRTVRFVCDSGYEFEGASYAQCVYGTWRLPVCKGEHAHPDSHRHHDSSEDRGGSLGPDTVVLSPVSICGSQPFIENGDVTILPGERELKVQCQRFYKLQGPEKISCVNEKWTELPVCKPPCKLDRTLIHSNDEYLQEGEEKRFYCRGSIKTITIYCSEGRTLYGECRFFDW
ncbi:complement factor H-like isoform X3 [Pangasianodon hypophthalmus]|uniref:complement factor H-like isoform X3 n=1 Tax=Pangasianodon hypophthalmus TaxID=310915 RepID=UPI002307058A|nr:complement factor H-like isoform X3 [Pangasianodon hypophthalmus]